METKDIAVKKIMIVEDDKMLGTISKMFLHDLGHELIGIYRDGAAAIEKCKEEVPDIIFMDIHIIGDLDGFQTARIIQQTWDVPIIYLSSDREDETIRSVINSSAYGYLLKPVDKNTMGSAIEFATAKHRFDVEQNERDSICRAIVETRGTITIVVTNGFMRFMNQKGLEVFHITNVADITGISFSVFLETSSQAKYKKLFEEIAQKDRNDPDVFVSDSMTFKIPGNGVFDGFIKVKNLIFKNLDSYIIEITPS